MGKLNYGQVKYMRLLPSEAIYRNTKRNTTYAIGRGVDVDRGGRGCG